MKKQKNIDEMENVHSILKLLVNGSSYETCIQLSMYYLNKFFYAKIKDLVHCFPQDAVTEDPVCKKKERKNTNDKKCHYSLILGVSWKNSFLGWS